MAATRTRLPGHRPRRDVSAHGVELEGLVARQVREQLVGSLEVGPCLVEPTLQRGQPRGRQTPLGPRAVPGRTPGPGAARSAAIFHCPSRPGRAPPPGRSRRGRGVGTDGLRLRHPACACVSLDDRRRRSRCPPRAPRGRTPRSRAPPAPPSVHAGPTRRRCPPADDAVHRHRRARVGERAGVPGPRGSSWARSASASWAAASSAQGPRGLLGHRHRVLPGVRAAEPTSAARSASSRLMNPSPSENLRCMRRTSSSPRQPGQTLVREVEELLDRLELARVGAHLRGGGPEPGQQVLPGLATPWSTARAGRRLGAAVAGSRAPPTSPVAAAAAATTRRPPRCGRRGGGGRPGRRAAPTRRRRGIDRALELGGEPFVPGRRSSAGSRRSMTSAWNGWWNQ